MENNYVMKRNYNMKNYENTVLRKGSQQKGPTLCKCNDTKWQGQATPYNKAVIA